MATIERYQTASGATLFMVRYRTPQNTQTKKRGFTTKRDAQAFAATVETAKLTGSYVAHKPGRVTVGELGPAWLPRQRGHMKPSGWRSYDSCVADATSHPLVGGRSRATSGTATCRRGSRACRPAGAGHRADCLLGAGAHSR